MEDNVLEPQHGKSQEEGAGEEEREGLEAGDVGGHQGPVGSAMASGASWSSIKSIKPKGTPHESAQRPFGGHMGAAERQGTDCVRASEQQGGGEGGDGAQASAEGLDSCLKFAQKDESGGGGPVLGMGGTQERNGSRSGDPASPDGQAGLRIEDVCRRSRGDSDEDLSEEDGGVLRWESYGRRGRGGRFVCGRGQALRGNAEVFWTSEEMREWDERSSLDEWAFLADFLFNRDSAVLLVWCAWLAGCS
jgi:hypothetical protein